MQRKLNPLLLLFTILGGAAGFAAGEAILSGLSTQLPRIVVAGLYFGVLALFIGLFALAAELIAPRLNGASWRQRYSGLSWKLLVPATLLMLLIVGSALQFVYGLDIGGLKPVKDIVLVIDNSGSMQQTDPGNERYKAAKQLIGNMDSDNRVAVVVFDNRAELLQPFTSVSGQANKDAVNKAIDSLVPSDGGTDFSIALSETMKTIDAANASGRGTMVILLSDGFSDSNVSGQLETYRDKRIAVNTIGLSLVDARGAALLQQIADSTGGSYHDVTEAGELSLVFQNIYDTLDDRSLLTERTGASEDSISYMTLRILSLMVIGIAVGLSLGLVFDNRYLARSFGIGGAIGGLAAGFILEWGLSGSPFADGMSRLAADLALAAVIGLFPVIVPVRENSRPLVAGRNGRSGGRPSAGLGKRPDNDRSHGF